MPEEYEWPEGTTAKRKRDISAILWTAHLDGPFEHESGQASAVLRSALEERDVHIELTTLSGMLRELQANGKYAYDFDYLDREINGKRTYKISLAVGPKSGKPFPSCPFDDPRPMNQILAERKRAKANANDEDPLARVKRLSAEERASEATAQTEQPGGKTPALTPAEEVDQALATDIDERFDNGKPADAARAVLNSRKSANNFRPGAPGLDRRFEEVAAMVGSDETEDEGLDLPSIDLVPVEEPRTPSGRAQARVLDAVTTLYEALELLTLQPALDLETALDARIGKISVLVDQINRLENDKRALQEQVTQLNQTLRATQETARRLQRNASRATAPMPVS